MSNTSREWHLLRKWLRHQYNNYYTSVVEIITTAEVLRFFR